MLIVCLPWVDASRIHVSGLDQALNDQVGYISVARSLADTGQMSSHIIYPSVLWQHPAKDYFYLPGHYLILAASYKLFGFGVWQSLLPNLAAFVLAAVGVLLAGARLYARRVGLFAAFLFIVMPANVIYSFTAMSEMTRVAAGILVFAAFLYLAPRARLILGPLLLVIPFLFRETGALLVIPMALLLSTRPAAGETQHAPAADRAAVPPADMRFRRARELDWPGVRRAAGFCAAALVLLLLVYRSDAVGGRPNLVGAFVFDPSFATIHTDAIANQMAAGKSLADWAARVPAKVTGDLVLVLGQMFSRQALAMEGWSTAILLALTLLALSWGIGRREPFILATGLMGAATLLTLAILFIPDLRGYVRWLLFLFPFQAIILARLLVPLLRRSRLAFGIVALLLGLGLVGVYQTAARLRAADAQDDHYSACAEQIRPDDSRVIAAPYFMGEYFYRSYPVQGALVPANAPSLALLLAQYRVGILFDRTTDGETLESSALTIDDLSRSGFTSEEVQCGPDEYYLVFRARQVP